MWDAERNMMPLIVMSTSTTHTPRDEETKPWTFPLQTNSKPTQPRLDSNSKHLMTRQSKHESIALIPDHKNIPKIQNCRLYLQYYAHVNTQKLIQVLPSVPIFTTHIKLEISHWQSPLHWVARAYNHCCLMMPLYISSNNKGAPPSNPCRTCHPQLNQKYMENNCRYTPFMRVTTWDHLKQFSVGLSLQLIKMKQFTSIWLKNSYIALWRQKIHICGIWLQP